MFVRLFTSIGQCPAKQNPGKMSQLLLHSSIVNRMCSHLASLGDRNGRDISIASSHRWSWVIFSDTSAKFNKWHFQKITAQTLKPITHVFQTPMLKSSADSCVLHDSVILHTGHLKDSGALSYAHFYKYWQICYTFPETTC